MSRPPDAYAKTGATTILKAHSSRWQQKKSHFAPSTAHLTILLLRYFEFLFHVWVIVLSSISVTPAICSTYSVDKLSTTLLHFKAKSLRRDIKSLHGGRALLQQTRDSEFAGALRIAASLRKDAPLPNGAHLLWLTRTPISSNSLRTNGTLGLLFQLIEVVAPPLRHPHPLSPVSASIVDASDGIRVLMSQCAFNRIRAPQTRLVE